MVIDIDVMRTKVQQWATAKVDALDAVITQYLGLSVDGSVAGIPDGNFEILADYPILSKRSRLSRGGNHVHDASPDGARNQLIGG